MENKELTGYPNIDMPWMKYYDKSLIDYNLPQKTIYQYMKEKSNKVIDKPAISYFGKNIPYGELYENIEKSSKGFTSIGIKANDRILFMVPNIPESAYTFYGASEIGAVSDYIDPRPDSIDLNVSSHKVLEMIKRENINQIVALDQCYYAMIKPIEDELLELGIDQVILISATDSMNFNSMINYFGETLSFNGLKALRNKIKYSLKMKELVTEAAKTSRLNIIYYDDLIRNSNYTRYNPINYQQDLLTAIVHSSGTTSTMPKPIPLTHDNLNGYVHQSFFANMPMQYGDKALHILPYFAAYGLTNNVHSGFCHGTNMIQIPGFMPINLGKLIKKYKPQTIMGAPSWFVSFLKDPVLANLDLSFIRLLTSGGDSISPEDEIKINDFLEAHNCFNKITKGHGMSETSGCSSFAIGDYNIPGSIGIPIPLVTYGLVDPKTKELLKFKDGVDEIEGEIIIAGPTVSSGQLDGKTIFPHRLYDGKNYIFSNDIASMNRDGVFTFKSRNDRTFTRFDGYKVKSYEIEEVIKENSNVKYCIIAPYFDEKNNGNMPIAYIVPEDNYVFSHDNSDIELVNEIVHNQFFSNKNVSSRQIPSRFKIISEFPLTKNEKVDFKALAYKPFDGDEIIVDIDETNLSIKDVKIYKNVNSLMLKKQ